MIPPAYVKAYVRRGAKNDATDAAAICEAVARPNMRFVPIKSLENQGFLMLHRARGLLVRQRTMTSCAIRACRVRPYCWARPTKGGWFGANVGR
nr:MULTISPECIES: transposase [unclassified Bradyrhizobium]